ncbi:MAG TPA: prolyl oligopeptidase family serine peptidase [Bryobacteraceae bacterium]|nr:prolyl oligopeptidase family serine peptidase [Bryobacteraceae bacterium]
MRLEFYLFFLCMFAIAFGAPPPSKRIDFEEQLHGVKVTDPYRWLEDVDSSETRAWVIAQSQYARAHLDKLPGRAQLLKRITELMDYTRYPALVKRGKRIFFLRREGLQNQAVLYVQEPDGRQRILLDPNAMAKDGTAALSTWEPSPNGKYVVYGIAVAGSDWQIWRVRGVDSGKDLDDRVEWIKFAAPVWSPDNKGVYYTRFPEPPEGERLTAVNFFNKVYYHRLGTKQSDDKLLYERPDQKEWRFDAWASEDGRYLLLVVGFGTAVENQIFYQDLRSGGKTVELIRGFDAAYVPIGSKGSVVYFQTTDRAPRGRVIAIDLENPDRAQWKEIIPQSKDTLEQTFWTAGKLICQYMRDVKSAIEVHDLDGKLLYEVKLPGVGQVVWSSGAQEEMEQFFSFTGFTTPGTIYGHDLKTRESRPVFPTALPFDTSLYETKQVFYASKDGTRIPMFLTYRRNIARNGENPTLLYGYGGFSVSLLPSFSILYLAFLEKGGVVAIPNLRGGGEYGEEWHRAGMKQNKQNVFDDFIGAAQWLIANKYTSSRKLAMMGGSNGGLLVGASLNQRPDLFAAAIPMVGVMDMLRFHKFTVGQAWTSDYGNPDHREDFVTMMKYSPLQNIRPGVQYPPTLIMTADHDDRVVPAHSFKYGAALQHAQEGKSPILIRIETSAGHGAGKPASKTMAEYVDIIAFLQESLRM